MIGFLIYSNTLHSSFVFDDPTAVSENGAIRDGFNVPLIWKSFGPRFILGLSFALNYSLSRQDVISYHFLNIVIHVLNTCLVYLLVQLLWKTLRFKTSALAEHSQSISFLVALIFLVHPLQTQAVTYIWQRATSLSALFYLAALCSYLLARIRHIRLLFPLALLFTVLAMLTKETAITLPIVLLVFEIFLFRNLKSEWKKKILFLLPFLLSLAVIPLVLTRGTPTTMKLMKAHAVHEQTGGFSQLLGRMTRVSNAKGFSRRTHMLTSLNVMRTYMRLLLFPVGQNVDYDYPRVLSPLEPKVLASIALIVAILVFGVWSLPRQPVLFFGILWFFLLLLLESFVVVTPDVIFEHRLYLPSVGFWLFTVSGCFILFKNPKVLLILFIVAAVIFSGLTYRRNRVWESPLTLWTDSIAKSPKKARPFLNLGVYYFNRDEYKKALLYAQKALDNDPEYMSAYHIVGFAKGQLGDIDGMLKSCLIVTIMDHENWERYLHLSMAYSLARDYDKAIENALKALNYGGNFSETYNQLGYLSWKKGQSSLAKGYYDKALEMSPGSAKVLINLAMLNIQDEHYDAAAKYLKEASGQRPEEAAIYYLSGIINEKNNNLPMAAGLYRKAVGLKPGFALAHWRLGHTYHLLGDDARGAEHIRAAEKIKPGITTSTVDTLDPHSHVK